jgi:dTDP-4-amino-4,6-dideoxygalactose transaminase
MKTFMKIPFLDLRIEETERNELLHSIETVFKHGKIVLGPEVLEFENLIADYCNRKYALGVSSGSDALYLSLRALDIGKGDEVITTSLSWIATANAIARTGATVVFADINDDLNIDPESVKKLITKKTKAILPVHFTGKIAQMKALSKIANDYNLYIVEDAAQAFGAKNFNIKAGNFGDISAFSMNPMKVLGACGEAGVILTDSESIYEKLKILRYNGTINREICVEISLNCRLDTIQAAILISRFSRISENIERRRNIAKLYNSLLQNVIEVPIEKNYEYDIYYTYTIKCDRRDDLKKHLEDCGIETKIQHPYLMSQQPIYKNCLKEDFNANKIVKKILSLPCHEKMTEEDVKYISNSIKGFYDGSIKY